jgi:hypothetical protein
METTTQVSSGSGTAVGLPRRPGLVTFAAVVTFIVGGLFVLLAISEFANSYWFYGNRPSNVYNFAASHLLWWGIFDTILAVLTITAGASILRGGVFGLIMGLMGASFSFLRWLFYIPATPWLAITIIAVDALVIYGLCASMEYFAEPGTQY